MGAGYGNHDATSPADAKADAGPDTKPDTAGLKPPLESGSSAPPSPERRDISTPGAGSLPDASQGDEVDPATD